MKKKTIIIAEIGINHNGSIILAKKLIDKAKLAKVDYVKFQSFIASEITTKKTNLANYQKKNANQQTQYELLKNLELSFEKQNLLFEYCKKKKIKYLSTPFDLKSLNFLKKKLPIIKISSTDLGNLPFLKAVGKIKKKIILSTGMSSNKEIDLSIKELLKAGMNKKNITLLYCHSAYPTNFLDLNLNSIVFLKYFFNLNVGFSDHTIGIEASVAAVALGATVIEKHFTLDKKMTGPDHSSSLNFEELKQLVDSIRNIEKSLGPYEKKISKIEMQNKSVVKKSIVAFQNIKKNDFFSEKNLTTKRSKKGISPLNWYKVLGTKSKKNYSKDEEI